MTSKIMCPRDNLSHLVLSRAAGLEMLAFGGILRIWISSIDENTYAQSIFQLLRMLSMLYENMMFEGETILLQS